MKKIKYVFLMILCLFLIGCNNEFAEKEYEDTEKIAASADRYSKEVSVYNQNNGGFILTVSKFNGRETLWTKSYKEACEVTFDVSFVLSEGKAKVVHIDEDETVITVMECTSDTCSSEFVTVNVPMKKGKNRIKIVGYDCEDLKLEMLPHEE